MTAYYKAVRPDGSSFHDPTFTWATEPGGMSRHPSWRDKKRATNASGYLSVSTSATDCTGMRWPCRLLLVEPVGATWVPDAKGLPNKVAGLRFRTVGELPATDALGPQGVEVAALIERMRSMTWNEWRFAAADAADADAAAYAAYAAYAAAAAADADAAAYAAAYADADAAYAAAYAAAAYADADAAYAAAYAAAAAAAADAAAAAVRGLVTRHLIGQPWLQRGYMQAHYDTLTMPWRRAIGRIHPDDAEPTP